MSNAERPGSEPEDTNEPSGGPNLVLLYGLIALALATAIAIATLIVLPFYHQR